MASDLLSIDPRGIPEPPPALFDFVRKLDEGASMGPDRRAVRRYPLFTAATVLPLDSQLQPVGDPFKAVTRDISTRSIAMVHARWFNAPMFAVQIPTSAEGHENFLAEMVRCENVGRYYQTVGILKRRLNPPPCQSEASQ
jgi:hypothetical protein